MLVSYFILRAFFGAVFFSAALLGLLLIALFKGLLYLVVAILVLCHMRRIERNIRPKKYASEEIRKPIEWAPFVNPGLHERDRP